MRLATSRAVSLTLCSAALFLAAGPAVLRADIQLIGTARFPGEATDHSGLTDKLKGDIPHNRLGGISAIEYTGHGNMYLLLPDRGPNDGDSEYRCRFHALELIANPGGTTPLTAKITATTMLQTEHAANFVGSAWAFDERGAAQSLRFDPEGIRIDRQGQLFISDEYGPSVYRFAPSGRRTAVLNVPRRFQIAHPAATPAEESAKNTAGRQTNGGLEGLAISPDGLKLFAAMQRPLLQDSQPGKKRTGTNTRVIEFDLKSGSTREFLYPLDVTANGVSEILAVNGHEFLVLERDGRGGAEAVNKRIYRVDLQGATDISSRDTLPASEIPADIKPARKTPFIDLLAPRFGLAGSDFPEKLEGLAFGPDLPDGRRLLVVAVDNDHVAERPILLWAFAIDRQDLPGFGW